MQQTKHTIFVIMGLLLLACQTESDQAYNPYFNTLPDNELVFEVIAGITPVTDHIDIKDTLWLSIHITDSVLTEKISQQKVTLPLCESRFIVQYEVVDLIENQIAGFISVEKNGTVVQQADGVVTAKFGHPNNKALLDIGIVFEEVGRYAIVFHNYPNPNIENAKQDEEGGKSWYDLMFYEDPTTGQLLYNAFVEYRFSVDQQISAEQELFKYIGMSAYSDAIYQITVR